MTLTEDGKNTEEKKTEQREEVLRTYEIWLREREKNPRFVRRKPVRHSLPPARTRDNFEKSLAKMMTKDDSMQNETWVIADKL